MSQNSTNHHSKQHSNQNPHHKERRRETKGTRYHNTPQTHPVEQHSNDNSKGEPNSPTDCPAQAHNTKKKKVEHIRNHTNPQHIQKHINYQMQTTGQSRKMDSNIALQNNRCGRDHSSTSSSEIIWNNISPKTGENQISTSRGVQPHRTKATTRLTLPHRH